MRKARRILPTDFLALAMGSGRGYHNEARPRERLAESDCRVSPLETAVEQWLSPRGGRSAWVSVRRQRLLGLVAARPRGTRQAWEIECLFDRTPALDALPDLLQKVTMEAGRAGAEKLFLRLRADSQLLGVVRKAGFSAYQEETLLRRLTAATPDAASVDRGVRPISRQDAYPAFRLYNRVTPEVVRRSEAVTFGEWQAAQERRWLKDGEEYVLDAEDGLAGLLRVGRVSGGVAFDLLIADDALERLPGMIALVRNSGSGPMTTVVPRSAQRLARGLEEAGFEAVAEFVCLMRRTTRPVEAGKLVPAMAKTAAAP
jgi:hypothetical protein